MRPKRTWLIVILACAAFVSGVAALAVPPVNCRFVLCAYPDCLEGEHTEIPPGQCCPVCVPD